MPEEDKKCSRIFNGKVEKTRPFCVRRRAIDRRWGVVGVDGRGIDACFQIVQAGYWAIKKTPIQWVPERLSVRVKRPEREADHSPLSSVEVTNSWS